MAEPDPIIVNTIVDNHTLGCPLCEFTIHVPDIPVSDALGGIFGMSGRTLALVHAEQSAKRVSSEMRRHLEGHDVMDWLPKLDPTIYISRALRARQASEADDA